MHITISRTQPHELTAAINDLEARGWQVASDIVHHRREVKRLPKTARKERNTVYYEGSEKYYVRMRKEDH